MWGALDGGPIDVGIRFVAEDRDDRGRVERHQIDARSCDLLDPPGLAATVLGICRAALSFGENRNAVLINALWDDPA